MLPFRSHLSVATAALVLVRAGRRVRWWSAAHGSACLPSSLGFVVLDVVFIPPYGTLVGRQRPELAGARRLRRRRPARRRGSSRGCSSSERRPARHDADSRRLLVLSELLVADKPVHDMLAVVASSVRSAFELETVALLLPSGETGDLEVVASDGPELGGRVARPDHAGAGHAGVADRQRRRRRAAAADTRWRPPGGPSGSSCCAAARSTSTIAACWRPTPTTPPSPSSGPSCATRRCGRDLLAGGRRMACGARRHRRPRPAHAARLDQGGRVRSARTGDRARRGGALATCSRRSRSRPTA